MNRSICGRPTKFTSNNMDRAVACGFLRKRRIRFCCTTRHAAVSDTLQRYGCGTASSSSNAKRIDSMGRRFFTFLKALRCVSCHSGRRVMVLADNARYHHARLHRPWRERAEERFALEFLPAYSPEFNPIERAWKLTRRQATHNRHFPLLDGLIDAVEGCFSQWRHGSDTLRRLCAIT